MKEIRVSSFVYGSGVGKTFLRRMLVATFKSEGKLFYQKLLWE